MNFIYDEIIIGCGFAGLYWCYKTKPDNFIILEKSERIGGRVYNIEWNGSQISLGGGIIKSTNTIMIDLVKELDLELGESMSKYHLVDLETKTDNINKPNENNFYESNKIIIKYLKKIFEKNKNIINQNKLNWNEFLNLYLDHKTSTTIKSNLLYKSYSNADIQSVFSYEIDELLRTQEFKIFYIKESGYTGLLNKLIEIIKKSNIYTNNEVIKISKKNTNLFEIITKENKVYLSKKIILATESKTNIEFELGYKNNLYLNQLYRMASGCNYIRIYSYHKLTHGLKYSYRSDGMVGKVIYINPNILMCCYTENIQASELNNLLKKNSKQEQINIIYNLLIKCSIPIKTIPDDIIIHFWNTGVHYNTIEYNKDKKKELVKKLTDENIIVIGESVSDTHGWVNSALESVEYIYMIIKKNKLFC